MNDVDQTRPLGAEEPQAPQSSPLPGAPTPPPAADVAPGRSRFVDRVLGMRAVLAVAVAGLVVGGVGGALLGATTDGGNDGFGRGPGGFQGGQFQGGQFQGGPNGQMPNRMPHQPPTP